MSGIRNFTDEQMEDMSEMPTEKKRTTRERL